MSEHCWHSDIPGENPGSSNLEIMDFANSYTSHVGKLISSALPANGLIIDFGAGNGKQTLKICRPSDRIVCVEPDPRRQIELKALGYSVQKSLSEIQDQTVSCLISVNCIEHVADDEKIVREFGRVLNTDGVLVIYVPALPILYSKMDIAVGHYRRYTKKRLDKVVVLGGFRVEQIRYVDSLGVLASLLFKMRSDSSGTPSKYSIWIYDRVLFPLSRVLDIGFNRVIGKNLLLVAKKA
jgi:SAM-dependent methyltransferase